MTFAIIREFQFPANKRFHVKLTPMHCVARVKSVVASGVGGFAKANILIYVGLRSAPPNLLAWQG
ncbi:hypothetical protein [Nostoc sp.]|uniref:hypothetical protein n=1 Tax=Nostoc sp. TaxID=1180 RepID=UPI002FFA93DC